MNRIKFDAESRDDAKLSGKKWFPYNKGGAFRRWYGNYDYVVNWEDDGKEIRNFTDDKGKQRSVIRNPQFYFREAITWSKVSSGNISFRKKEQGNISADAGMSIFTNSAEINWILAFLNSSVTSAILKLLSPTMNYEVGHISAIPIIPIVLSNDSVLENLRLTREDWLSNEEGWKYFKKHPLI